MQIQQSSLPPQPTPISHHSNNNNNNNNRISADLNSYNGNNNNNNAALEPIDENRPQQRIRNNINSNVIKTEADKFKSAEGLSHFS